MNYPLESCLQRLVLQRSRIVRSQLQPGSVPGLFIRARIFRKLYGETRAMRTGDGIHRLRRMEIIQLPLLGEMRNACMLVLQVGGASQLSGLELADNTWRMAHHPSGTD